MGKRAFLIIDGSNLYFKLKSLGFRNLLSFKFSDFAKSLAGKDKLIKSSYYVGAVREKAGDKKSKELMSGQMKLFSALRRQDFEIVRGYLLKTDGYHEKGVDVNMAVDILVSSDTDLLPAVTKAKQKGR